MFEKAVTKQGKSKLMVRLCLTTGEEVEGEVFAAQGERLADILNDSRAFLPIEAGAGAVRVLAKAVIAQAHIVGTEPTEAKDPYKILRVPQTATDEELRRAWMNGLKASHPDRLASLNMDEGVVYAARKACQRINSAYEAVMAERRGQGAVVSAA